MQNQMSFKGDSQIGTLYLVPTPIGNLADMTYRAVDTLRQVDLILAEDTRQTHKLLQHYAIETPVVSFHEHSSATQVEQFIAQLLQGQVLGLVSDAGMPLINDPGHPLVQSALRVTIPVISLPGPNAALTALIASGLGSERFTYYGFFPRKKNDQIAILDHVGATEGTALFYESPHRIAKTVQQVVNVLGAQTPLVIARELTKTYENYLRGTAQEVSDYLATTPIKGEIVLLIRGGDKPVTATASVELDLEMSYRDQVLMLMERESLKPNAAIKQVAKLNDVERSTVYQAYHQLT